MCKEPQKQNLDYCLFLVLMSNINEVYNKNKKLYPEVKNLFWFRY